MTLPRSLIAVVAVAAGVLVIAGVLPSSAEQRIECRDEIEVREQDLDGVAVSSGARAVLSPGSFRLTGVGVFDGPPEQKAALIADDPSSEGPDITWDLSHVSAAGAFVSCDYAQGLVRVVTPLEPAIRNECVASLAPRVADGGPIQAYFVCK